MKLTHTILLTALTSALMLSRTVRADDTADSIQELKRQIQELDQKVRVLERQKELDADEAEAQAKETPRIVVGNNGVSISSANTNFVFQLHGVLQVDNHTFFDDGDNHANDGFILRRARPIFSGTVYRDWDFMFVPDFGGSSVQIFDAYVNYRYQPWLQLRAGKFKAPIGLEALQADLATSFSERSLVTDLVPARDVGFQLWGDVGQGRLSYAAGVFNGAGDARNGGTTDFEDHREFAGRVFVQPFRTSGFDLFKGLGFGVGGSVGNVFSNSAGLPNTTGGTLPGYATEALQQFFAYTNNVVANGEHWRISPQGSFYSGPFGLIGEYAISQQRVSRSAAPFGSANLRHSAWQVTVGWVLTGEDASYTAVVPKHPFDLAANHWGALQLVGRYSEMDIDSRTFPLYASPASSATEAQAWSVGLNWYLNRNIRLNASYTRTTFDGGGGPGSSPPANVTRQPEQAFITRLQLAF
jgi:phosphate-selective porin OprO/OprP